MHWYDHMSMGWGGGLMMVFWIVVLVAAIFLIVKVVQKNGTNSSQAESPLDVLKKRYARGEISKEEFVERKRDLL
jgi:putative membrane protein